MTTNLRAAVAAAALLTSIGAHAVPYTLPTSDAEPFAQLQPENGGSLLCATWVDDGDCDVEPGFYRLVTYTPQWLGRSSRVEIGNERPSGAANIVTTSQECDESEIDTTDEMRSLRCSASCPAGSNVIATQCDVLDATESGGNFLVVNVGGRCIWQEPTSQIYFAFATCLTE